MHACIRISRYRCTDIHLHLYNIHFHDLCMCIYPHIRIHIYMYICMYACVHACMHVFMYVYVYAYLYVYVYTRAIHLKKEVSKSGIQYSRSRERLAMLHSERLSGLLRASSHPKPRPGSASPSAVAWWRALDLLRGAPCPNELSLEAAIRSCAWLKIKLQAGIHPLMPRLWLWCILQGSTLVLVLHRHCRKKSAGSLTWAGHTLLATTRPPQRLSGVSFHSNDRGLAQHGGGPHDSGSAVIHEPGHFRKAYPQSMFLALVLAPILVLHAEKHICISCTSLSLSLFLTYIHT